MLSKSLIQFSIDGLGCVPSLLFDLSPNYGGGKEDNRRLFKRCGALLHSVPATLQQATASPRLCWRLLDTHGEVGQSLVGSLLLSPGSWCAPGFVCALQESVPPVLCKLCNQIPLASKVKLPGDSQSLLQIPRLRNLLWVLELS